MKKFLYSMLFIFYYLGMKYIQAEIRVVCTAAIIPRDYNNRKYQYIESLTLLKKYGLNPYVFESCQSGPTFLDEYCNQVYYTKNNNSVLRNYGINEAHSLIIGFVHYNFNPEDLIIKITGRYPLRTADFIKLVENNSYADAIVRAWSENDVYTGLFAIKLKYFLDFLIHIDYDEMEKKMICVEHLFGAYITRIKKDGAKIFYLEKLYSYMPVAAQFLPHR